MSQLVGELVKSGQRQTLLMALLMWESTTTAGILMAIPVESGVSPLTQIMGDGATALFRYV